MPNKTELAIRGLARRVARQMGLTPLHRTINHIAFDLAMLRMELSQRKLVNERAGKKDIDPALLARAARALYSEPPSPRPRASSARQPRRPRRQPARRKS